MDSATAKVHIQKELEAWEYNANDEDQRLTHKFSPNRPVQQEHIHELGVLTWKLDVDEWEKNTLLETIKTDRGYKYSEVVTVCPKEMEDFEEKVKGFLQEHMHSREEIRLILDGNGYWDIRDYDGKWIRFRVTKGDMIVLPPGMFHRFTLDENNYIKALLLYTDVPYRTQHGAESESAARKEYVDQITLRPFIGTRLHLSDSQSSLLTQTFSRQDGGCWIPYIDNYSSSCVRHKYPVID